MKAIVMAGGFAKRMWPLTKDRPKPLLPVAGRPIIEHVLDKLVGIRDIHTIYITTNKRFEHAFREWLDQAGYDRDIRLVIEDHQSDEEKLGSIGAVKHLIDREGIDDDVLCVAGDNLLEGNLHQFLEFFQKEGSVVFGLHRMEQGDLSQYGVVCIDEQCRVIQFEEKPEKPASDMVSTGIYAIPSKDLKMFSEYLSEKNNPDAFGYFISWAYSRVPTYGFVFHNKWFDIGSFEGYREANEYMHQALGHRV